MHELPPGSDSHRKPSGPAQPYLEWALATRFSYLRDGDWIPLLIEFSADVARRSGGDDKLTALAAFATRRWLHDDPRTLDDKFLIPDVFSTPPALLKRAFEFNFCIGLIRRDVDVVRELIGADGWKRTVLRAELGPPVDFAAKAPPAPPRPIPTPAQPQPPRVTQREAGFIRRAIGKAVARVKSALTRADRTDSSKRRAPQPPAPPGAAPPAPRGSTTPPGAPAARGAGSPPSSPPGPSGTGSAGGAAAAIDRVVIAVIDQGIAFANARFFDGAAPRIEYLWQQNVLGSVAPGPALMMPFTPGFELDQLAIQNAVAAADAIGAGEDWVYRNFGGLSFDSDGYKPLARRTTHGTHVLDLATAVGAAIDRFPIIAVDMPEDAVGDPAGSTLSVQVAWALIYILDRAERLRRPNETLPVVANLSYGPHEGPHDGSGLLETFMDAIWHLANASDTPLEVVLAAGNFRQTRAHAKFGLRPKKRKSLRWRVQPGSLSPHLMEIWLPPGAGHQLTLTLKPPSTLPAIAISTQGGSTTASGPGGLYEARYVPAAGSVKADSIVLSIARTAPDPSGAWGGDAFVPSGIWHVTLGSPQAIALNAWIKRSDTLVGRRAKGRQSHFDDRRYPRFDRTGRRLDYDPPNSPSYVRRAGTLSGIATGKTTRVIAGYRDSDDYPARYSSHGARTTAGAPTGPDWLECSDESDVLRGLLAAGTRSGSVVSMNGTSVAAPQATAWIARAWRGLAKGQRPAVRGGLQAPKVPPHRPMPASDLALVGNRLAPFVPRTQRRHR